MPKLVHAVTVPVSLSFLTGQASFVREHGYDVWVVSSPGPELEAFAALEGVTARAVPMARAMSPLKDILAIVRMTRMLRQVAPEIVHAHTPKAGLVAMIASWMARTPCRIFHIHGHAHTTARGLSGTVLKLSTRISCALATRVMSVSASVAKIAVDEGLCGSEKISVPCTGSGNGVDARHKFAWDAPAGYRAAVPSPESFTIGFAGRIVRDKGISELHDAWRRIRAEFPNAYLRIAGGPEERDAVPQSIIENLRADDRVRVIGWTNDMPDFYRSIDVLALPSYREGLPTVVLEAAAMQVPSVVARSVGCVDAVVDGVTGTIIEMGDADGLARALSNYLKDPELRARHGRQARERVLRDFRPEDVWRATLAVYETALASARQQQPGIAGKELKRLFDICASLAALLLLSPLMIAIAAAIRMTIGGPVFFRQTRPGLRERPFRILKFRTMREASDAAGSPLPDAERLTPVGRFLRATSLDEVPELWNVLVGDMSLVGPRPLLPEYLGRYNAFQRRRHEVRPGITGWAQIHGRNGLNWREKFEHDVWYVENRSLWLDLKILARTLITVVHREGISSEGHATMPEFTGAE